MAKIALDTIILGRLGEIHRGDEIPATYPSPDGTEADTDFDRLEDLGLVGSEKDVAGDEPDDDGEQEPSDAPAEKPKRSRRKPSDAPAK